MNNRILLFWLIVIILGYAVALFSAPVRLVDEPQVIVAGVKGVSGELDSSARLVTTHPFLGYLSYALFARLNARDFEFIHNAKIVGEPKEWATQFAEDNPEVFSRMAFSYRLMLFLFFMISVLALFLLTRTFFSETSALLTSVLFAGSLTWLGLSTSIAFFEVPQLAFLLVSFLFFTEHKKNGSAEWFAGALVFFVLAVGTRLSSVYVLPAFVLAITFDHQFGKSEKVFGILSFILATAFAILVFFPNANFFLTQTTLVAPTNFSEVFLGFDPYSVLVGFFFRGPDIPYYLALLIGWFYFWNHRPTRAWLFSEEGFLALVGLSVLVTSFFVVSKNGDLGLIARYVSLATIPTFFYAGNAIEWYMNKMKEGARTPS